MGMEVFLHFFFQAARSYCIHWSAEIEIAMKFVSLERRYVSFRSTHTVVSSEAARLKGEGYFLDSESHESQV